MKKKKKKKKKVRQVLESCKKLLNMRLTEIPIVVGALGAVPKNMESRLEGLEILGRYKTI